MQKRIAGLVSAVLLPLCALLPAAAQVPYALQHWIPAPPVGVQGGAQLGFAVAGEGDFTIVGAPYHELLGNDSGAVQVFNSSTGELLYVLPNPSPSPSDYFGFSVAISGTWLVVGAPSDNTGAENAGSVYVYDLSSGTPTRPIVTLHNPGPPDGDQFGISVAISGARVVVGARSDDTGAFDAGSAYVYDLSSGTPTAPIATLNNPGPALSDEFGISVAISGTRVVVGAPFDDTGAADAGSAYVYDLSSGTPTAPTATLNNPGPAAGDRFGISVAISGRRVVVGAPFDGDDPTGVFGAGSAYVYDLSSGTPTVPVATLSHPGAGTDDSFGCSVAISGTRVVVGALRGDTGVHNGGSAFVFDLASASPALPVATLNSPTPRFGVQFGYSVAISGVRVVVGEPYGFGTGSAYRYDLDSGTPSVAIATLNKPGPAPRDQFGGSVAISGTRVVVGAALDGTGAFNAGSAYVYDSSSATPTVPIATLNNPSPASGDQFGISVAISGTRVVVGAAFDDTGASDAGTAYVYDLNSRTPTVPVATLNKPGPAATDQFGIAVAISGTRVVVGAPFDDTGALDAGSAYVYDLSSGTPTAPVATLNDPRAAAFNTFGYSVAISGTGVLVGARGDNTGAASAGRAYAYELSSATPTVPVATLNNPNPRSSDLFGYSVALSGKRAAVGTFGSGNPGRAYAYDLSGATPSVPAVTLNNPDAAPIDGFGSSVAISGTRVVVGARRAATAVVGATGSAYVYDFVSGSAPVATLHNPDPALNDLFGNSVGISGTRVVVGTPLDESPETDKGSAYIFDQAPAARALNISTRLAVQAGEKVLIEGFIVSGPANSTKKVMIRGLGPSLSELGFPASLVLTNPYLELNSSDASGLIAVNDDWRETDVSQIPLGFQPKNDQESIIIASLPVGSSGFSIYTAVLKGATGESGIGVTEIYDLDSASSAAQLTNLSTRGFVDGGDNVMIGGFILAGGEAGSRVVVRAIGPSLARAGIANSLRDPTLDLRDANGARLLFNDNWQDNPTQAAELVNLGLAPTDNAEAAVVARIPAGNYTAIVAGNGGQVGIGLVEVYNVGWGE